MERKTPFANANFQIHQKTQRSSNWEHQLLETEEKTLKKGKKPLPDYYCSKETDYIQNNGKISLNGIQESKT